MMLRAALVLCLSIHAGVASASYLSAFPLPPIGSARPNLITSGSDGNLWYSVADLPLLVRLTPTGQATEFPISEAPMALAAGENGELWYLGNASLGRLAADGSVTTFRVSFSRWGTFEDMLLGPDGNLWIVAACTNNVYRVTPEGVVDAFPVSSGGCPYRMALGADGNIWVTLHYGDKIARVTPNGTVTEFPTPQIYPDDIAAGPDGHLYFTANDGYLGRITTAGVVTLFSLAAGHGAELTLGSDGNFWLTDPGASEPRMLRVTPTGQTTVFPLPTGVKPLRIATGSDGRVWFTDGGQNVIRALTTTGSETVYPSAARRGDPTAITFGADGNLWFTEPTQNKIGRITPAGAVTEWAIPTPASGAGDIVLGPDGAMWFTELEAGKIGRATPTGITEFPIPGADPGPTGITRGIDGNLWFTLAAEDTVGRMTPAGVVTKFPVPRVGRDLRRIVSAPDGTLWMTTKSGIARMSIDGSGYDEFTPFWGTHPNSLAVALDGTIWFADGNAVGRVDPMAEDLEIPRFDIGAGLITAGPDGAMWASTWNGEILRVTLEGEVQRILTPYPDVRGISRGPDGNVWFTAPRVGHIGRIKTDLPIAAAGTTLCASGLEVDGIVATFTDSDPASTAEEFSAEAIWSDGVSTPAVVTSAGDHFVVTAAHVFSTAGTFSVEVRIRGLATARDAGGSQAIVTSAIRQAVISAPAEVCVSSSSTATVAVGGSATSYVWTVSNGSLLEGQGTPSIRFAPTAAGPVELSVSANAGGCIVSTAMTVQAEACFRGDVNGDRVISVADAFFLIHHLFAGGPAPAADADANSDGVIDAGDLTFLTNYLLADGPSPLP